MTLGFDFASWDEQTAAHVRVELDEAALAHAAGLVRESTFADDDGGQSAPPGGVRGGRPPPRNGPKPESAATPSPDAPPRLWLRTQRAPPRNAATRGAFESLSPPTWALLVLDADFDAAKAALAKLLDHRRRQEVAFSSPGLVGEPGLLRIKPPLSNTPQRWEQQLQDAAGGGALPDHLLFVGGPDRFPFSAQFWIDTQPGLSTGRLDLGATPTGPLDWPTCTTYADKVVRHEKGELPVARRALFYTFATDAPTQLAHDGLVAPLRQHLTDPTFQSAKLLPPLTLLGNDATTDALCKTLGNERPALVMTTSHGIEKTQDPAALLARMGALTDVTCAPSAVLSADRLPTSAFAPGAVFFAFACFSAGTPRMSTHEFLLHGTRTDIAPRPFISALPRALLAHPEGPVAFIGHIDRATSESFADKRRLDAFRELFTRTLARGATLGAALRPLRDELAYTSHSLLLALNPARTRPEDHERLLRLWMRYHDQAGYMLLGDPLLRVTAAFEPG